MEALHKKYVYRSHVVSEKDQKSSPGNFIYHHVLENSLKENYRSTDWFKIKTNPAHLRIPVSRTVRHKQLFIPRGANLT